MVVGGATAVAGLVLGASIVLGPPSMQSNARQIQGEFETPGIAPPTDDPDNIRVNIHEFDYSTFEVDADGQIRGMRLRAARTNLKPQGITELIKPVAEIRLGPQRAITVTADRADMEMEDRKPRQGQFAGNVVVTLFQAPVGTQLTIDPSTPRHEQFVQQRIYLDHATDFSIEDDTIHTQGPVHVTSGQVDFFGIGLQLAYNTQRERIQRLVISEGRYLIINPDADAPAFNAARTAANTDPASTPNDHKTPSADEQKDRPKQFYAATFQGNVLVQDGIESELAGQTLTIDFSLGTDAVQVSPITPNAVGQLPPLIPIGQLAQANTRPTLPALAIPTRNRERSLLVHDPKRDIVVTWTGPLAVSPHPVRPLPLIDEDDAHLTLVGPNAYAQTTRNGKVERIETHKLEYLLAKEQTTAYASHDRNLRILSTALGGEITGKQLVVRQQEGTATILGPGQLTYTNEEDGKALNLTWQNRLDLELYTSANTPSTLSLSDSEVSGTNRQPTQILGVKTATFAGQVTAKHTDFNLGSDKLTLAFAKPDKAKGIDNTPAAINASGHVSVQAQGDAKDETFNITAGRLSIDLALDDHNDTYASAIRAVEDVHVSRPGSELVCNRVSVELNAPQTAKADIHAESNATPAMDGSEASDAHKQPPHAQVRSIFAVGQVRAKLVDDRDRRIHLLADQLIADVSKDKLTLASDTAANPAEITDLTTGRKITGQLIEMDDQAEQLHITGAGSLATVLEDPHHKDADIEDAFLAIQWTKSMAFNNRTGKAEFHENVRSESRRSIDSSDLTCDRLIMTINESSNDVNEQQQDGQGQLQRHIQSAIATGNVTFLAAAWDLKTPNQINNRLRLEGPKVVITNRPAQGDQPAMETLVVKGEGRMVLEDYRLPSKDDADDKATLTGRGATLFSWDQSMALNALSNNATLLGTVQMVHLPKDAQDKQGDPVQLDCQKLVADLTETGGLAGWLGKKNTKANVGVKTPSAQIQSIVATDAVRLLQQGTRSMRGDELVYDGTTNRVTLNAQGSRDVILEDLNRDTATRTNKVTWDLSTDRIEIDQLRGGAAPLN